MTRSFAFVLLSSTALAITSPGLAQSGDDSSAPAASTMVAPDTDEGLGDIVVTAQRRAQALQSVPISVQAFTGEKLDASGIMNTADLALITPGLVVARGVGLSSPFLRGIGSSSNGPGVESPVATYVDGVYYGSKADAMSSLANVERVEVLKGPQGTLFGRNATGGLIQIITRDPSSTPGMNARVGYANYETVMASGYVTGGLAENVAADLAVDYLDQGKGWGYNTTTGNDVNLTNSFLARAKLLIRPSDDTKIVVAGDYSERDSDVGASVRFLDGVIPAGGQPYTGPRYGVQNNVDQFFRSKARGASATLTHDFRDITFTSITAYRRTNYTLALDSDASPAPTLRFDSSVRERQFSQELQLSGGSPSSLEWTAGLFYFDGNGHQTISFAGIFYRDLAATQTTRSYAAYAQLTYPVMENTRLTLGARYNAEKRTLSGQQFNLTANGTVLSTVTVPPGTDAKFNKLTWRVALEHDLADDVLGYASYNRGFRSGGFNPSGLTTPPFRPEVLDAFELGLKSSLLDRRLRLNLAAFYYDFKDIQLSQFALGVQTVRNAAQAELYGVDLDMEALLTSQLRLTGSFEYLKSKYKSFPGAAIAAPLPGGGNVITIGDASGNDLIRAPRFTVSAALDYSLPLNADTSADFNVTYSYNDGYFGEPDNLLFQPSFSLVNARATLNFGDRHKISIWGRNLTDKYYTTILNAATVGSVGSPGEPRTYGLTFETRF